MSEISMGVEPVAPPNRQSLVTPDLIARAQAHRGSACEKKYAEVVNTEYTVKLGPGVRSYEYRVLQSLQQYTYIPTPRPIDFWRINVPAKRRVKGGFEDVEEEWGVVVMSTIPGKTLASSFHALSKEQRVGIMKELKVVMDQLNEDIESGPGILFHRQDGTLERIQRPSSTISDLDDNRCLKLPLLNGWLDTPVDIADFTKVMSKTARQPEETSEMLQSVLTMLCPTPDSIRFCHRDLHQLNIMVDNGRLSGIIDWEMSGWYTSNIETYTAIRRYCDMPGYVAEYVAAWDIDPEMREVARHHGRLEAGVSKRDQEKWAKRGARARALPKARKP
jgi:aminoglycoside phosphotransferase